MTEPDTLSHGSISSGTSSREPLDATLIRNQRPRNRFTTVETVTYEREDGEPFQVPTKCWRPIEHDTQPYQREIKIEEEWKPIDLGWSVEWDKIGTVSILHLGEKTPQKVPTHEELALTHSKTLLIALGDDPKAYLEVNPLDSFRAILSDPRALRIRSSKGTIRLLLTIFPG